MRRFSILLLGLALLPGCAFIDRTTTVLSSMWRGETEEVQVPETVSYRIPNPVQATPAPAAVEAPVTAPRLQEAVAVAPLPQRPRNQSASSAPARTIRGVSVNMSNRNRDAFVVPTSSARSMPVFSTPQHFQMPEFSSARQ